MKIINLNDMSGVDSSPDILYSTDNLLVAKELKSYRLPYVLIVKTEDELNNTWGHDYLLYNDGTMSDADMRDYMEWAYARQTRSGYRLIEGERIDITEISVADRESIYHMYEDPEAQRFLEEIPALTEDEWIEYLDRQYSKMDISGYAMWAVRLKTGEIIGRAGFMEDPQKEGYISLGYLIDSDHRQKGYAKEAVRLIMDYAKDKLPEQKINAYVQSDNKPSVGILSKLSDKYEISINIR